MAKLQMCLKLSLLFTLIHNSMTREATFLKTQTKASLDKWSPAINSSAGTSRSLKNCRCRERSLSGKSLRQEPRASPSSSREQSKSSMGGSTQLGAQRVLRITTQEQAMSGEQDRINIPAIVGPNKGR